ncbi:hypothetical protein SAMN02745898_1054 [Streptomyces sp. 136MFCol5.1]|nr:hypothetical protein SAMN02745898_1054 [Streptomyces sp. 136MFCol5.1]
MPVVGSVVMTAGPPVAVTGAGSVATTAVAAVQAGSPVMIVRRGVTTTVVGTAGRVVMTTVVGVPVVASSAVTTGRVGPVGTTTAAAAGSAVTTAVAAVDTAGSVTTVTGVASAGVTTVVVSIGATTGTGSRSSGFRFPTTSPVTRSTRTFGRSC